MQSGWMYARAGRVKADRLYGITLYLLNHKRASGRCLAETFEVSLRCIQRDMDTLSMAGVPIIAYSGVNGGYELQEGYKLPTAMVTDHDHAIIAASLKSMESAGLKKEVQTAKLLFPQRSGNESSIQMDFSIADETAAQERELLRKAIKERLGVRFSYTDALGNITHRSCEPIGLIFRWYSWYLVAWDLKKKDYRIVNLRRIDQVQEQESILHPHPSLSTILRKLEETDTQAYWTIRLLCQPSTAGKMKEYFQGTIEKTNPDASFLYTMRMPKQEYFWYAKLLGMGAGVRVLEPQELIDKITKDCQEILQLYKV